MVEGFYLEIRSAKC